jgi:DNA-binding MarR family transcriptional regulator
MPETDDLSPEEWDFWDMWMRAQRALLQEIDRRLQDDYGISKAEFSVLMTLLRAPGGEMRVVEVAESLDWEKSRVSHQLTRMEARGLVTRTENGASGRRTGVGLTAEGRRLAESSVVGHAGTIRRCFLDPLTAEQRATIRAWSEQMIAGPGTGAPPPRT